MKLKNTSSLLLGILFFSCAQVRTPMGGEKDMTPPVVLKTTPENFSTQFNSKKIVVEFDEFLQLNDVANQLIVSPPFKEKPIVLMKGKKLEISIKDTLAKNTTYNFNFGNSIQDLAEANVMEDFVYVFSTGNYIDSLEYEGKIKDAFTSFPEKGIVAMLYDSFEDSVITTRPPNYFAKTKDDGSFKIKYIKPGDYKMIAIKDESNNFLYDFPAEYLAFTTDTIHPFYTDTSVVDSNKIIPTFQLYKELDTTQYIKETITKSYGFIQFVFNIPNQNFRMEPASYSFKNKDWNLQLISDKKDTATIWVPDLENLEDIDLVVYDGTTLVDTINWYIGKSDNEKDQPKLRTPRKLSGFINNAESAFINFNNPIRSSDFSFIKLMEDTLEVKFKLVALDSLKRNYKFIYPFRPLKKYEATLLPGSFTDVYNTTNDTINLNYKVHEAEFFGTVSMKLNFKDSLPQQYIFQLLSEKGGIIKEAVIEGSKIVSFNELSPTKCMFRIIKDSNRNKIWDTGNYKNKTQPEKVIYYQETVDVRSNWDVELEWEVEVF